MLLLPVPELFRIRKKTLAWEPIPANDLFIANVLPRTKNIRLGPGVSIMPQHHPANVAVRLAMLVARR